MNPARTHSEVEPIPVRAVREARRILDRVFGRDADSGYELRSRLSEIEARALSAIETDLDAALLSSRALTVARSLLEKWELPENSGCRHEALTLARKIFGELRGRSVRGEHHLVEAFLAEGARLVESDRADILVAGDRDLAGSGRIAFLMGTGSAKGDYRFELRDLDELARRLVSTAAGDLEAELDAGARRAAHADDELAIPRLIAAIEEKVDCPAEVAGLMRRFAEGAVSSSRRPELLRFFLGEMASVPSRRRRS